jgi:hypothetical protein
MIRVDLRREKMAATKKKAPPPPVTPTTTVTLAGGERYEIPADLSIPAFLKRHKDEAPADPVAQATATAKIIPINKSKYGLDKPMGMTDEEYETTLAKFGSKKERRATTISSSATKEAKTERAPRKEAPAGTFKLTVWAREAGHDPRIVRRVARAFKKEVAALQVQGMKYIFDNKSKDAVAKLIIEGMASETKKTVRVKAAPRKGKIALPAADAPDAAVWSGDAKKRKPAPAPKAVDPKAEARKVAKTATREFNRAVKDAKGNKAKAAKVLKKTAVKAAKKSSKK